MGWPLWDFKSFFPKLVALEEEGDSQRLDASLELVGLDLLVVDEVGLDSKGTALGQLDQDPVFEHDPRAMDMTAEAYYSNRECRGRASVLHVKLIYYDNNCYTWDRRL